MSIFKDYALEFFNSYLHTQYQGDTIGPIYGLFCYMEDQNQSDGAHVYLLACMMDRGIEMQYDVTAIYDFTIEVIARMILVYPETAEIMQQFSEMTHELFDTYVDMIEKTELPYRIWKADEFFAGMTPNSLFKYICNRDVN